MRFIASASRGDRRSTCTRACSIVLESTTYPGTTREVLVPRSRGGGCELGEDVFLAFSPERVDPGNKIWQTRNTPKVIGGITPRCLEARQALYEQVIDTLVPVSSTDAAEMVKLLENTFRAVNIGLVNEVAIMCDSSASTSWEVIDAAATKPFGFMPFYPGPGPGRALHPDRSALPVVEAAHAEVPGALHRARRRHQQRHARARRGPRRRRAERRRRRRSTARGSWSPASPTSATSPTCASRPRSTSSRCSAAAAPRSATTIAFIPELDEHGADAAPSSSECGPSPIPSRTTATTRS